MSRRVAVVVGSALALFISSGEVLGKGGVVGTPHDLSAGGPGIAGVTKFDEARVCIFCHAPHGATKNGPLWNRDLSSVTYDTFVLTSTQQKLGQPSGPSRLCLSCHDGTIALASFKGSTLVSAPLQGSANLGLDLTNDHPISFSYPPNQAGLNPLAQILGNGKIRLDGDLVQCTTCHDPHNNEWTKFLVMDNSPVESPLCITCHDQSVSHDGSHTTANLIGCMTCHAAHNAVSYPLLTNYNCTDTCHNGISPTSANIKAVLASNVTPISSGLSALATATVTTTVAVKGAHGCVDCHNPHQATSSGVSTATGIDPTSTLTAKGALKGVLGVSAGSQVIAVAQAEYEICYRCHSGLTAAGFRGTLGSQSGRIIAEPDQMKRFDRANPSFHPVAADRQGSGASLLISYQGSMFRIACSDCHNSDQSRKAGGIGPNGPHGSRFPHLLMAQYEMPPATAPLSGYSGSYYSLCYRCHDETYIMGASSGFYDRGTLTNEHDFHVRKKGYPCFVCHDPHGVPAVRGATTANNAHLINFDGTYTRSATVLSPFYLWNGVGAGGSCTVSCHGVNPRQYRP